MVEIETTDAYKDWYLDLEKKEAAAVDRKVKMLQILGLALALSALDLAKVDRPGSPGPRAACRDGLARGY